MTREPDYGYPGSAFGPVRTGGERSRLHADIAGRLSRIYAALGRPEEAFEANLRRLEADPGELEKLDGLEEARTRAGLLLREEPFREWCRPNWWIFTGLGTATYQRTKKMQKFIPRLNAA